MGLSSDCLSICDIINAHGYVGSLCALLEVHGVVIGGHLRKHIPVRGSETALEKL